MIKRILKSIQTVFSKKLFWILFIFLTCLVILFRNSFFGVILDFSLSKRYPELKVNFKSFRFKQMALNIEDLELSAPHYLFTAKEFSIGVNFDFYRFLISPKIELIEPVLFTQDRLNKTDAGESVDKREKIDFFRLIKHRLECEVKQGLWNHNGQNLASFSIHSNFEHPEIKKLSAVFFKPLAVDSKIEVDIIPYSQDTFFNLSMEDFDFSWVKKFRFLDPIFQNFGIRRLEGILSGHCSFRFDRKWQLHRSDLQLELDQGLIESDQLESIAMEHAVLRLKIPQDFPYIKTTYQHLGYSGSIAVDQLTLTLDHYTQLKTSGKIGINLPIGNEVDFKGVIQIGQDAAHFVLKGESKDSPFNTEEFLVDFYFTEDKLKNSRAHFSFFPQGENGWLLKAKVDELHADYISALQKTLDYYFPVLTNYQIDGGFFSLEAKAVFEERHLCSIEVDRLDFQKASIRCEEPKIAFNCDRLQANMRYDLEKKQFQNWAVFADAIDLDAEETAYGHFELSRGQIKISQEAGVFSNSFIKGQIEKQDFNLVFKGDQSRPEIHFEGCFFSDFFSDHFHIQNDPSGGHVYDLVLEIVPQNGKSSFLFQLDDIDHGYLKASFDFEEDLNMLFFQPFDQQKLMSKISNGKLTGAKIHQGIHHPILKLLRLPWYLEGNVDLSGEFNQGKICLDFTFDQLSFVSDELFFQQGNQEEAISIQASLKYDALADHLHLVVPLKGGICLHKESNLWFEEIVGDLTIEDTRLSIRQLEATAENLKMRGNLDLEFLKEFPFELVISVDEVEGKVFNLQRLARHFPEFHNLNIPFDGDLKAIDQGFQLRAILYPEPLLPVWSLQAKVERGEFFDLNFISVQEVYFDLVLDSASTDIKIKNLSSVIEINGYKLPYQLSGRQLSLSIENEIEAEFELALESAFLTVIDLKGVLKKSEDYFYFDLDSNRLLDQWTPFEKVKGEWKQGTCLVKITQEEICSLWQRLAFNTDFSWLTRLIQSDSLKEMEAVQFHAKTQEDNSLAFFVEGISSSRHVLFDSILKEGHFELSTFNVAGIKSDCALDFDQEKVNFKRFHLSYQDCDLAVRQADWDFVKEKGYLVIDSMAIGSLKNWIHLFPFLDDSLDGAVTLKGGIELSKEQMMMKIDELVVSQDSLLSGMELSSPLKLYWLKDRKIALEEFHLRWKGDRDHTDYFTLCSPRLDLGLDHRSFHAESIEIAVAPEIIKKIPTILSHELALVLEEKIGQIQGWDNLVKLNLKVDADPHSYQIHGRLEDGYYRIKERAYLFENTTFSLDKKQLQMKGLVNLFDYRIGFQSELDLKDRSTLVVAIENTGYSNELAKAVFALNDQKIDLVNFYGRLFGIDFNLLPHHIPCLKDESILTIGLDFDPTDTLPFLPSSVQKQIQSLKMHQKVGLKGNLLIDHRDFWNSYFKGFIASKNLELKDFVIQDVQALVTFDHKKLKIEDFSLADAAILTKFDQMVVDFDPKHFLDFDIKNICVHDFRPSLIKRVNQPKGKIKPFLIRQLEMEECKGNLVRLEEIKGKGHLKFINTFKREYHLMDIPLEIIARLGLDMGLLIPVRGEVDLEIKDKKIWLKDLKNSFSDGKRSHFYFPSNRPCFIDFDGNIQIDVKMKQYVLFKLTQPFTLSMRGNFSNPSFSLK